MLRALFFLAAPLMLMALAATPALAALEIVENFDYPDGTPIIEGVESFWQEHSPGGANPAGDSVIMGQQLVVSQTNSGDISYTANRISTGSVFAGYDLRVTAAPTSSSGSYFSHINNQTFRARLWIRQAAASGDFDLGVTNSASASSNVAWTPNGLSINTTYRLIVEWNCDTDTARFWIDPTVIGDPSIAATDGASPADFFDFSFRQTSSIGTMRIDNLVVATTFDEALRAEPATGLVVRAINPNKRQIEPGDDQVSMIGMELEAIGAAETITALTIQTRGNGLPGTDVDAVRLYEDVNGDSLYDAGDTLIVEAINKPFPGGANPALQLTGFSFTVNPGTPRRVLIAFDFDMPNIGRAYGVNVTSFTGPTMVGPLPVFGIDVLVLRTATFVSNNPPPRNAAPGTTGILLGDVTATLDRGTATISDLILSASGSLNADANIDNVRVWREEGTTPGFQSAQDLPIGPGTNVFTSGMCFVAIADSLTAGVATRYYVTADLGAAAGNLETFGFSIEASISGATPDGLPVNSAQLTVDSNPFINASKVEAADPGILRPGANNVMLLRVLLEGNNAPVTLTTLDLTYTGALDQEAVITQVNVFRSGNDTFDPGIDALVATANNFGETGTITLTLAPGVDVDAGNTAYLLVTATVAANATEGTIGADMSNPVVDTGTIVGLPLSGDLIAITPEVVIDTGNANSDCGATMGRPNWMLLLAILAATIGLIRVRRMP